MARPRALTVIASLAGLVGLALTLGHVYALHESVEVTFLNDHRVDATPADVGAPFDDVRIPVFAPRADEHIVVRRDLVLRVLDAFVVRAPGARAAVLLCHGQDETISNWTRTQKYLLDHHVSSLVFDYSAYGRSTGERDPTHLRADAAAAYRELEARFPDEKRFVFGFSLGSAVCLSAVPDYGRGLAGLVLAGAWSSTREIAVSLGEIPRALAFIVPQMWDSVAAVTKVDVPLLVVQVSGDELVPLDEPQRIFAAAREPKSFVVAAGFTHNAPWQHAEDAYWGPVLDFIAKHSD